jgi:hypothetical protein
LGYGISNRAIHVASSTRFPRMRSMEKYGDSVHIIPLTCRWHPPVEFRIAATDVLAQGFCFRENSLCPGVIHRAESHNG